LWQAYEMLDKPKVKWRGWKQMLMVIVSLVRFAQGDDERLVPFGEFVSLGVCGPGNRFGFLFDSSARVAGVCCTVAERLTTNHLTVCTIGESVPHNARQCAPRRLGVSASHSHSAPRSFQSVSVVSY